MTERDEFIIALAMLRGAEFELVHQPRAGDASWWNAIGNGHGTSGRTRVHAAEGWLKEEGIHVGPNCEIADLSTRIKDVQT